MDRPEIKQVISGKGTSICPSCIHCAVCRGVENQPCISCSEYRPREDSSRKED